MKKLFLLLTIVATFSLSALAQTVTVHGNVVAASDQEPVIGATVKAKGTTIGTQTDIDGNFTLTVPADCKKLVITYVGMFPAEVDVKPQVTVVMENDTQMLDEIVVTGYGQTKKAAFTGAASIIDGDVVDRKSEVNFVKSLEGVVTGFQYNNAVSGPGMWGSVQIRGLGTLSSSSQPLYVIDGVPVNASVKDVSDFWGMGNYFDPMAAYNPADIESITVLKDAAATAIYGSRAANGVVVITTKKGGQGNLNITFETRQGFTSVANNNMKYANAQQMLGFVSNGLVAGGYYDNYQEAAADVTDMMMADGWDGKSSYDWFKAVTRKGYYADYNLSVNGTTGKTNYYINLNYNDSEGIMIGSSNKRYGGRLNLDSQYKWMTVGANMSYSQSVNDSYPQGAYYVTPIYEIVCTMTPFYPFYTSDGEYANIDYYNPLAIYDKKLGDLYQTNNNTLVANPWLKIDLPYGFWAKTNFGANITGTRVYSYWSAVYNPQGMPYNGVGQQYSSNTTILTWNNTFGWNHSYGENNIDILFGQEMQRENFWEEYYARLDFPYASEGMRDLSTAAVADDSYFYKAEARLASYFADAHYDYANKYYLSASYRRDGSSRFGANKRWANFWSVGAKWRLTQEKWFEGNTTLTNADVRISYGTVGNQGIGYYAARGNYTLGYNYNYAAGMVPTSLSNPNLTWETSKKFDVGFDLSFLNRWHATFDFYNEDTEDALYSTPLSMTTGLASTLRNIGKIRNRGIEFGVNGTAFYNNDAMINVFANLTWNKNKVIKLANGTEEYTYQILEEGRPFYQWYTREYAGVNPENGAPLYYLNEDGDELTEDPTQAAKRYLGSPLPKLTGAFGVSGNFYGFDFALQFNYRLGSKLYKSGAALTGWGSEFNVPLEDVVLNSWTPENPTGIYPQFIYGGDYLSYASSRFIMNGSFLRLSNITFGYTLPAKLTRKAFLQKVRLYTTFDNVHTWTAKNFVGYTPDTDLNGVFNIQYPGVFTFTGGLQITF